MASRLKLVRPSLASIDTRTARIPPKTTDAFYLTYEWRKFVNGLIRERGRRCQQCRTTTNADGTRLRIFGDHIHELKDGGATLDPRNVQLLCGACHTRKTSAARTARWTR